MKLLIIACLLAVSLAQNETAGQWDAYQMEVCVIYYLEGRNTTSQCVSEIAANKNYNLEFLTKRRNTKMCFNDYLEGRNVTSSCESEIADKEKEYFARVTRYLKTNTTLNCAEKTFKDYMIKAFFLYTENTYEDNLYLKRSERMELVGGALRKLCEFEEDFNKEYKEVRALLKSQANEIKSKQEEKEYLCSYKYFVEKKIIDSSDFGFDTSPFDSFDCTKEIDWFNYIYVRDYPITFESKFNNCVYRRRDQLRLDPNEAAIKAIVMFDLSEVQEEKLKALIQRVSATRLTYFLLCARDHYNE